MQDSGYGLAGCCPNLTAFQINCWVHPGDAHPAIWSTVPSIREVIIATAPPEDVISRLKMVQSVVRITDMNGGVQLAR